MNILVIAIAVIALICIGFATGFLEFAIGIPQSVVDTLAM